MAPSQIVQIAAKLGSNLRQIRPLNNRVDPGQDPKENRHNKISEQEQHRLRNTVWGCQCGDPLRQEGE